MNCREHIRNTGLAITLLLGTLTFGQQEVMISQYMFNGLFLNPAYAGSHHYFSTTMLHRSQWLNVEGAPTTSMFSIDGPLMAGRMGIGFSVIHDRIGVTQQTEVGGNYAYHLNLGSGGKIAFGLKAALTMYSAQLSDLTYWDEDDQVFQGDLQNAPGGKFGFGAYWYSMRSFAGLSIPALYAADQAIGPRNGDGSRKFFQNHHYLHAGHVFQLNSNLDLKASTLLKYLPTAPFQADVNFNLLYRGRIWMGLGYRSGDSYVGMVEYQVKPELRIGYAYDMTTSPLSSQTGGSHELLLGLDLGRKMVKLKTPRYF